MTRLAPEFDDAAWLHGLTAFTTIRTKFGTPLLWTAHLERLKGTCAFLGLPDPVEAASELRPHLPSFPEGRLRLTVTSSGLRWSASELPRLPESVSRGVAAHVTTLRVHPQFAAHKTGNYLPYVLALRAAHDAGTFEGLLLGEQGTVVDGSRTSFVLDVEGRLVVPIGGLPSVTRAELLRELREPVEERFVDLRDLARTRRMWLAGSGVGVLPVSRLTWSDGGRDLDVACPSFDHPALRPPLEE
ncbi:aminotransferase class IV [Deinococcus yavapaiensis]|uniref:4-amino-4-deoxychorismate lyase n=1 Tax=Deinococcus yavapaiensis KR-236 TaxID=694435 RepID=A0A318SC69_9DEIO|nr:aminotransferase class IV [Deinococcus yavapaiensis]PYE56431.1 4-amino-4-deoxychorismate lyase [Deinococcus yavapaiensis KR-236]